MKITLHGQIIDTAETSLTHALASYVKTTSWDDLRVAVAYASVAGVLHLLDTLNVRSRGDFSSKWLLGLDDFLTQPGALRMCLSLPKSELRTVRLLDRGRRFHPKLMIVSQRQVTSLLFIGSSNLTIGGLSGNCEAFAKVAAQSTSDFEEFSDVWESIWALGERTGTSEIDAYEGEYNERSPSPPHPYPKGVAKDPVPKGMPADEPEKRRESRILTSDVAAIDPSLAQVCWIEVGKNTAMGRELEFKAEQAIFFDLSPSGGPPQFRSFIVSSGMAVPLRLKYQENAMWRLQMNNNVPEVALGLRPSEASTGRLGRSPYVAVFTRTKERDTFFLKFIKDNGSEYADLRRRSARTGTSGSTSTRRYGWC